MHYMSASVRYASVEAWENFGKGHDEEEVAKAFAMKGAIVQQPISSTHGMPPIHNVSLEAPDNVEAEDLEASDFPEGVLVHVEENF
ncbi:hypothetical protein ASPWEDRAFT_187295 [Aspergillus wentii DTO 134E9]|uniref:Uncharacterized protein n=1 Tax=Aspergillus wentii DTO 134E9 TaxID=1073089 RepID=A0A1L9R927_ASPWE|nr:uncharacterized protein ASPWEDRAFT_187295 [Aspergillus wentii DTO 134E9]KAI9926533.1 hypothetical protein MW887_004301 [Aspergillus wentii]OJJ31420.1 hypothetical protein ASPWEDRAFT_187295 [Aspergillus wentii DTO 134E9]